MIERWQMTNQRMCFGQKQRSLQLLISEQRNNTINFTFYIQQQMFLDTANLKYGVSLFTMFLNFSKYNLDMSI